MSINTDFYGNENDWIALSNDTPDLFKTAYTYDNNETYQGSLKAFQESLVTNPENVASPELDNSIIPWKINEESDVFNQKYIYPYCTDYTNPQQSTWMYQSSDYTQNVNGGFRFFIQDAYFTNVSTGGPNGVWVQRYSPLNTKGQLDEGAYGRLFPIVGFDYSKCYVQIYLLYVAKSAFDDITTSWTATGVNKMNIKDLIDDDSKWQNNYFYGIQYELRYKGLSGNAHSLGMFAYDKIKASPLSGGYYPYGEDFHHYQTAMTDVHDTGQMGRAQIGGIVGGTGNSFTIRWDNTIHTDIVELFKKNYDETTCLRHMGGLHEGENIVFNRKSSNSTVRLIPYRTYESDSKQDFIEYARKQAAYLGFPFSDYSYNMIDNPDKTYIPEIDSNGVTTGNYALASTQPDYVNADWTTDVYDKTPYDPENDKADDPNTYANESHITAITTKYSYGTMDYLMSQQQLYYLFDALNTVIAQTSQNPEAYADDMIKYFGTTNPYELFDTIIVYPRDFAYGLWRGVTSSPTPVVSGVYPNSILIGNTSLPFSGQQTTCLEIQSVAPLVTNEEQCIYFDKFKNFLDYQPYSIATMNVPWCGGVKLDPELYIGKNIQVGYTIDIQNGLCKAFIMADGKLIDTINGQVGARIELNAQDFGAKINAAIQATQIQQQQRFNQIKSAASLITGGALAAITGTGGADVAGATVNTMFGMAASEMAIDQANYRVEVTPAPIKQICSGSDTMSLSDTDGLELLIQRPIYLPTYDKNEYGHLVGFATLEFGTLSDYHGYTEIESIDFNGIAATEAEQEMIKSALKTGVYLP